MVKHITWQEYAIACLILGVLYYAAVLLAYYRKKPAAAKVQEPPFVPDMEQGTLFTGEAVPVPSPPFKTILPDLSPYVHDFVDELNALLAQAAADAADKATLFGFIQGLLQKYPALKGSGFQPSITTLIATESETQCSVKFNAEEQAAFWQ